jgi:hypothetical protein
LIDTKNLQIQAGDSLASISHHVFNGDVTRFDELLKLNPHIDVFSDLPTGTNLQLPNDSQILNYAPPVLADIGKITNPIITDAAKQVEGYAKEALAELGKINGILGAAETAVNQAKEQINRYSSPAKVVDWLLGGS